ncbi:MAG: hypothetical protein FRX49_08701 [Trebouxia sp. A1-2]|nr:MAG: hypothetical protein FRX49_08701 [Trebouxia sp. A1-2]
MADLGIGSSRCFGHQQFSTVSLRLSGTSASHNRYGTLYTDAMKRSSRADAMSASLPGHVIMGQPMGAQGGQAIALSVLSWQEVITSIASVLGKQGLHKLAAAVYQSADTVQLAIDKHLQWLCEVGLAEAYLTMVQGTSSCTAPNPCSKHSLESSLMSVLQQ